MSDIDWTEHLMPHERAGNSGEESVEQAMLDISESILGEDDQPESGMREADEADEESVDDADIIELNEDEEVADEESEGLDEGDDESEEEGDADDGDEEEPEYFPVTIDGEEYEVTLDELKNGYSRTEDYTRKRQRDAAEHAEIMAGVREKEQHYAARLEALNIALQAVAPAERSQGEWEALRASDPAAFNREYADFQLSQARLQKVREEQDKVNAELTQATQADLEETMQEELKLLQRAIPEWEDPDKHKEGVQEIADYLQTRFGFEPKELSQVQSHAVLVMIRESMQFRAQQSKGRAEIRKKASKATKRVRPGGRSRDSGSKGVKKRRAAIHNRAAQTGSQSDVAAAIFDLIGDDD